MQKTLQKQYEKCRLRDNDIIDEDLCEWEVIDVRDKEFCIVIKNEPSENYKSLQIKGDCEQKERRKVENKLLSENDCNQQQQ